MSQTSPIMWIELEDSQTADMIMRQAAKVQNPNGKAIMYPPQELFPTIKSIENNCKAKKASNPTLRYQVKFPKASQSLLHQYIANGPSLNVLTSPIPIVQLIKLNAGIQ